MFSWNRDGKTYTGDCDHDDTSVNAQGCQDTVRLKLTINNGARTDTVVTACKSFTWNRDGQTYTASGDHDYTFVNAQGCQDTVRLKLTISNGARKDTTATACGSFVWDRNGQTYTTSSTHDYTYKQESCNDTVRLKLTISNGARKDTTVTACGSFVWDRNGQTYTTSGTHDYTYTNGICTDTVRLALAISNGARKDTTVTACGSFVWDRRWEEYRDSGTHDYRYAN